MATAWELTRPHLEGRYQVTVYQMGWRLGGKGASGRGSADRIEEHGLHLWMGFYENAFRLMRDCYAELKRDPARCPIADWRQAFFPDPLNAVADHTPDGRWLPWLVTFPPGPGLPGDPPARPRWTMTDYLSRSVVLLRTLLDAIRVRVDAAPTAPDGAPTAPRGAGAISDGIARVLRLGELATLGAVVESARLLELAFAAMPAYPDNLLLRLHELIAQAARAQLETVIARDDEVRRLWEIAELTLAVLRGSLRFGLTTDPRGFDAIDDYDCREWLKLNGASDRAVNSAFVRGLYDLAFAYEDGDVKRPRIAAGQALRGAVRAFFTYRGAFFWKMTAGMGDVVFAPLYEALERRGVKFEFFHRLENVRPSAGTRPHIEALEFDVQARAARGRRYRPLVDVRGLPCWPAAPDWAQLEEGARLAREGWKFESFWDRRKVGTRTLRVGHDFDLVVLGVGVGAVPYVCRELVARDARWRAMVEKVKSVPTQAFQIWLRSDMRALGWPHGPVNISGFVEPFDTWADMSHLAAAESWPEAPGAIAYFCSVLPDDAAPAAFAAPEFPDGQRERVRQNAIQFLDRDIAALWPKAQSAPGAFRWDLLVGPRATGSGAQRFDSQYWTANVNPTDRYTLSLPGTLQHRISPLDDTYDNLTVAGDWTDCGFNEGCVEAAVMSGRLAAHAIAKSPPLEEIVGYDHP